MDIDRLAPREIQAVRLASMGKNNGEIAEEMGIKKSAVERYISRAYALAGCKGRAQLTAWWLEREKGE